MVAQMAKPQSWLVVDDQVMVIYVINSVLHLIILFISLLVVFIPKVADGVAHYRGEADESVTT